MGWRFLFYIIHGKVKTYSYSLLNLIINQFTSKTQTFAYKSITLNNRGLGILLASVFQYIKIGTLYL